MTRSDIVDIDGFIHAETEKAILFSTTGDKDDAVWLPRSQIEIDDTAGSYVVVTIRETLAIEKAIL